jgi:glycosyltransferase involved in cell wall biosynthesis
VSVAPLRLVAYTDATEVGGAEISLGNLLEALGPRVDATVLAVDERVGRAIAGRRDGTPVVTVPPVANKFDVAAIVAHVRALRRLRPDVLHVNLRTPYSCQYGLLAGIATRGVQVVGVEHLPLPSASRFPRLMKRFTSSRLAAHIAVGDGAARAVEHDARLAPGSIETIRNGVPERGTTERRGTSAHGTIGSIGRLDSQKGFDVLVAALPELPGETTCVVIGEGPERARLMALAAELGVADRLVLEGWLDDPRERLGELDVFVLPSRFEGFPLVIIEAMLAGVPVVATDVGSIRESIEDGVTGLLVQPESASELAHAVRRLLEDDRLCVAIASAARESAQRSFTSATMAARYLAVYERVTSTI